MTFDELVYELNRIGVPEYAYNLTGAGPKDERMVMEKNGDTWLVYCFERGQKSHPQVFLTQEEACDEMFHALKYFRSR